MSRMIQIRHVPDSIHRTLKIRAAESGMTLSDYLLRELRRIAEVPTLQQMRERLRQRERVQEPIDAAKWVRAERDSRDDRS